MMHHRQHIHADMATNISCQSSSFEISAFTFPSLFSIFSLSLHCPFTALYLGSREARAIVKAEPHFPLMHINETWANLSGLGGSGGSMDGTIALGDALKLHPSQEEQVR